METLLTICDYSQDPEILKIHSESWRGGWVGSSPLILFPTTTEQVSRIVTYCAEHGIALVPQGGNTGLVGGGVPNHSGEQVIMNLSRMNKIRSIEATNYTMTAEAGCTMQSLQEFAEKLDRLFPLAMASQGSAMVGGFVSTNAGGINVLRYGMTRQLTLGIEAVLPDGRIYHGLSSLRKDNTGYDIKQLFIGGEGTLGIITAATFQLSPLPRQKETLFLAIPDIGVAPALLSLFVR